MVSSEYGVPRAGGGAGLLPDVSAKVLKQVSWVHGALDLLPKVVKRKPVRIR